MVSQIESSTAAGTAEPTKEARQASGYGRPACLHCLGMQAPSQFRGQPRFDPGVFGLQVEKQLL
ncbi:hypothetical protein, partial [Micromonospora sp. NPDC005206]|uniref:hypothetical protein n=1 Tax=Micromonospora sp. NPDC005206 TaxID=3157022 RepID=UPI0033A3F9CF